MPAVPVKVYKGSEIRRFRLETDEAQFSFQQLVGKISEVFPNLDTGRVRLMWKDNDDELVMMTSNADLMEAVKNLPSENQMLRIHVVESDSDQLKKPDQEQENVEQKQEPIQVDPTLYQGVACDGCQGEIRGIRLKCLTCPNFDLCTVCTENGFHNEHPMIRIASPGDGTWKPAFIASQGISQFAPSFLRGFGSGGCPKPNQESKNPDQTQGQTNENAVRNLSEVIGTVLNAIGVPMDIGQSQPNSAGPTMDQKIASALEQMEAMGYRNDDGWLTRLLTEMKGDVSAVLDLLHPRGPQ